MASSQEAEGPTPSAAEVVMAVFRPVLLAPDPRSEAAVESSYQSLEAELANLESESDGLDDSAERAAKIENQRTAEQVLYDRLAEEDYEGPVWKELRRELSAYAIPILSAWFATRKIFRLCAERLNSLGGGPDDWPEDERSGLVHHVISQALVDFRSKGSKGKGWRADGGASVKTYFMTACIFSFSNIYRSWETHQRKWARTETRDPSIDDDVTDTAMEDTTSRRALAKVGVDEMRRRLPELYKKIYKNLPPDTVDALCKLDFSIVELRAQGYPHGAIAKRVGLPSDRAVEGRLYRLRKALMEEREL